MDEHEHHSDGDAETEHYLGEITLYMSQERDHKQQHHEYQTKREVRPCQCGQTQGEHGRYLGDRIQLPNYGVIDDRHMRRHVLLVFFFVIITQRIIVRAAHGVGRILAEKATGNLLHDHPRDGDSDALVEEVLD